MRKSRKSSCSQDSGWHSHRSSEDLAHELLLEEEDSNMDSSGGHGGGGTDQSNTSCSMTERTLQEHSLNIEKTTKRTKIVALMVVLMGAIAGAAFLYVGIRSENDNVQDRFERRAIDMSKEIDGSWQDYESSCLLIHESCRNWREENFTHVDFEVLYYYIKAQGLDFYAMEWVPNITHAERPAIEAVEKEIFDGHANYTGVMGQEPDPENPGECIFTERSVQPFYFPIHVRI